MHICTCYTNNNRNATFIIYISEDRMEQHNRDSIDQKPV